MNPSFLYNIAITLLPRCGDVVAKTLISYCGSAEAVFKEKRSLLKKIPGVGEVISSAIKNPASMKQALNRAEEEIEFIRKNNIRALFYADKDYPSRLKHCHDNPVMLYYKGSGDLNAARILSVVGTRNPTEYGKKICEKFIAELAPFNVCIVSGLAYGIDITAHKACLTNSLSTVGVLAHGLDVVYPGVHKNTAAKMLEDGGLLTDFLSRTGPDKENFPKRNRIVAGISDATVVVESGKEGGSMITADIAFSYNRDVFAFPGRALDRYSRGCNFLIKTNKAALAESSADILAALGWENNEKKTKPVQKKLFTELSKEELALLTIIEERKEVYIDELCFGSGLSMSKALSLLLNLEFNGIIKSLPGKMYAIA